MNLEDYFNMLHEMAKPKDGQSTQGRASSRMHQDDEDDESDEPLTPEDKGET